MPVSHHAKRKKKYYGKIRTKNIYSKGQAALLILILIGGLILVGGLNEQTSPKASRGSDYIMEVPPFSGAKGVLQMKSLIGVTPTPIPTLSPILTTPAPTPTISPSPIPTLSPVPTLSPTPLPTIGPINIPITYFPPPGGGGFPNPGGGGFPPGGGGSTGGGGGGGGAR